MDQFDLEHSGSKTFAIPLIRMRGSKTTQNLLLNPGRTDPVCPVVAARSANEAFEGSQVVEVHGYGHCSVAVPSVCIAKHVRALLYEGTLPDSYAQCEVDSSYFGTMSAHRYFEDAEETKIHLAQAQLAKDWEYLHQSG
ncbi:hypothetical protein N7474_004187 [Penicillium riverlandense]|uniref:uncharacterized protein n=1 Tax=Penicillium riverlandense TaxID=1903569 RepID=UPI002548656A|nr:uncharacterized protein N7474_004187 [Penicillium riverlandense]KAJ5818596.1 hypothetical protein N7474_004187 [Penicillium riverlandense]